MTKLNNYYSQLENEKGIMRNTWKVLNSFLRRSRKSRCREFTNNGVTITDAQQIANEFNQYFANVGPSWCEALNTLVKTLTPIYKIVTILLVFFKPTNEEETWR